MKALKNTFTISIMILISVLFLVGCSESTGGETATSDTQLKVKENTVTVLNDEALITEELTNIEVETITQILDSHTWNAKDKNNCDNDYAFVFNGELIYYHSECATFTKYKLADMTSLSAQEPDTACETITISETEKEKVNAIIQKDKS